MTKKEPSRPDWNHYFLNIAEIIATRATCPRKQFGAVITIENKIVSTGYNGSPSGTPHCYDVGCLMENNHCVRTIHAEINAIVTAKCNLNGATLYSKGLPCYNCTKQIIQSGIKKVVYQEDYGDTTKIKEFAAQGNLELLMLKD